MHRTLAQPITAHWSPASASETTETDAVTGFERLRSDRLRLEFSSAVVLRLLENRQLCAAEVHCLDRASKECLRKLLLASCTKTLKSQICFKK